MAELIYHPAAKIELREAAAWYEECQENLGRAFLVEAERTAVELSSAPLRWMRISDEYRRCRLRRFPYAFVYRVELAGVYVVAVMHLHRRPEYWRSRTTD